jgi:hypothetical protein
VGGARARAGFADEPCVSGVAFLSSTPGTRPFPSKKNVVQVVFRGEWKGRKKKEKKKEEME